MEFQSEESGGSLFKTFFIALFILILLGGITYGFYWYYVHGFLNKDDNNIISPNIKFFVKAKDYNTNEDIELKYELFQGQNVVECLDKVSYQLYQEDAEQFYQLFPMLRGTSIDSKGCYVKKLIFTKVATGQLYKGYNLININNEVINLFYYYSKNYYMNKEFWFPGYMSYVNQSEFSEEDKIGKQPVNSSIALIYAHRKSNYVNISLLEDIESNSDSVIRLLLEGEKYQYRHVNLCLKYSLGIVDIKLNFGQETYIPRRLSEVNKCYRLWTSLKSSNDFKLQQDFNVSTLSLNEDDYITVYVTDEELVYNGIDWTYETEDKLGRDVGAKDFVQKFKVYK